MKLHPRTLLAMTTIGVAFALTAKAADASCSDPPAPKFTGHAASATLAAASTQRQASTK